MKQPFKHTIFAPLPPPVGGVTAVSAMLQHLFRENKEILFCSPIPNSTQSSWQNGKGLMRLWQNSRSFAQALAQTQKKGRIFMIASAGWSFWEKLTWSSYAALRGRIPLIMMVDGNFPAFWESQPMRLKQGVKFLIEHLGVVLVMQSPGWEQYYRQLFPKANFHVISATAAIEYAQTATTPRKIQARCRQLLFVGHVFAGKGIFDLLEALPQVLAKAPDLSLRVIGPLFGKEAFWQTELEKRQLTSCVQLLGPMIEKKQLIEEYQRADIFVFPSHAEGLPGVIQEAMTLGLPCIATQVGAIPDLLDHGQAGVLIPPHAPQELAKAILDLIENPERRAELSRKASQRAREVYSYQAFVDSYRQLFQMA